MTSPPETSAEKPGIWGSLARALTSWRTASVTLLSFSSGLPLGLVWISIPDWMGTAGIDIRIIGLTTLAHAPWSFKMLWSPLMDRFTLQRRILAAVGATRFARHFAPARGK